MTRAIRCISGSPSNLIGARLCMAPISLGGVYGMTASVDLGDVFAHLACSGTWLFESRWIETLAVRMLCGILCCCDLVKQGKWEGYESLYIRLKGKVCWDIVILSA